ncbi:MAG TPA: class I SAM-dependent methyltransferase [Marmoricola sp.]|nr:class I SAM-dependent methyltransferase [Marmoricola sp.]
MATPVRPDVVQFGHLDIAFDSRVVRPDPGSEAQARWCRALLESAPIGAVLELHAGVGHVGLLTAAGTGRELVLVEPDELAREYAVYNSATAGMDSVHVCAEVDQAPIGGGFALIVCGSGLRGLDGLAGACGCVRIAEEQLAPGGSLVVSLDDVTGVVDLVEWLATRERDIAVQEFLRHEDSVLVVLRATGRRLAEDPATDAFCS